MDVPLKENSRKIRHTNDRTNIPVQYPTALPIVQKKDEILDAVRNNRVTIISGETGSGKSTQIPKMCLEASRGKRGGIACTQPRRLAAMTIAHRIAEELGEPVGRTVGYKIRFDEKCSAESRIKIMTDGILLAETPHDPLLKQYDTIIVDEAHERSVNIDFILGMLRNLLRRRKDLKVIITSATLDTEKFSRAFYDAPIIEVSGRLYHVQVSYRPIDRDLEEKGDETYIDAAVGAVDDLLKRESSGDILVFMPTEQDIRECCEILKGRNDGDAQILPLFSRLSWADQKRVFQSSATRKVIVATNIAETSLTIPGVRFVVDTGLARLLYYNSRSGTTSLPILPVSKSSAEQRKGRCGRVQDGLCIRLYSEADYQTRPEFNTPEILRSNLAGVILKMLFLNMTDIRTFPFIDRPSEKAIKDGFSLLYELGAISRTKKPTKNRNLYELTDKGRLMALLPIDPRVARMIIEGREEKCLHEILVIASALSIQDPRERPAEKEKQADEMHRVLKNSQSDFLTLLNIWLHYGNNRENFRTQNKMRKFCKDHFLSYRRMREWQDIYHQLVRILEQDVRYPNDPAAREEDRNKDMAETGDWSVRSPEYAAIHKSILSGYLSHIAQKREKNRFTAMKGKEAYIFPGSGLFQKSGQWIVAAEYVETSRLYARTVAHIEPEWLEQLGGHLCRRTYSDPHWDREKGEVVAFMQVSLFGFIIVPRRTVAYGRIDPELSAGLFHEALADGEITKKFTFLTFNQRLIGRIKEYEEKIRKRDLLVKREGRIAFYRERLPGITSLKSLQRLIIEKGSDDFLKMTEEDLLERDIPARSIDADYPDTARFDGITFRLSYAFEPGSEKDGVTLKVPINALTSVPGDAVDWLVPGLKEERVHALLKGLPKEYRKQLHPVREKAFRIAQGMSKGGGAFLACLSRYIKEEWEIDVPVSAWPAERLDEHLRMRYEIVDESGQSLSSSRDLKTLYSQTLEETENEAFEAARTQWEKQGLVSFDMDELPERIPFLLHGKVKGYFYPAVSDQGERCSLRLFKNPQEARSEHRRGMLLCYALQLKEKTKDLKKTLTSNHELTEYLKPLGDTRNRIQLIVHKVIHDLCNLDARNKRVFQDSLDQARGRFLPHASELLPYVIRVMKTGHTVRRTIENLQLANRKNPVILKYLDQLQNELANLLPPDFLLYFREDDFMNLIRYIRALSIRAERGVCNLEKDRNKEREVTEFVKTYDDFIKAMSPVCSQEKRRRLSELSAMIQEYKVSVFAQEIKTAIPVSRKRLLEKIQEIERLS